MSKKKILIIGGAGFIGVNSSLFFDKKKFQIHILDNFSRKGTLQNIKIIKKKIKVVKIYNADIRNFKKISKIINQIKPEIILHLAAQVAVTNSINDPRNDFEINAIGSFNILESCRLFSKKSLIIYSSTNKVYGEIDYKPQMAKLRYKIKNSYAVNEKQSLDFHSPYGCSKGTADQYFIDYSRIFNLKTVVLRQSCIYGKNQYGVEDQGWVAWFAIAFFLKKKVTIYGNGKQIRDLLYVDDLVELFYKIYLNKKNCIGKAFNVGGGIKNTLSILELVRILKDKYNLNTEISFSKQREGDQNIFICDNSRIKKCTKWMPKKNLKLGLHNMIEWISENLGVINKIL